MYPNVAYVPKRPLCTQKIFKIYWYSKKIKQFWFPPRSQISVRFYWTFSIEFEVFTCRSFERSIRSKFAAVNVISRVSSAMVKNNPCRRRSSFKSSRGIFNVRLIPTPEFEVSFFLENFEKCLKPSRYDFWEICENWLLKS